MDNNHINREIFGLVIGKQLGRGASRTVYSYALDPSLVVKVEERSGSFSNIREWEYWQENKEYAPMRDWLAPCIAISPCGSVLIQKRAYKLDPKKYPKMIPHFFTDTKYENFGMIDGNFVCIDYGSIPMSKGLIIIKKKTKLVKAHWWGDKEID